MEQIRVDKWLWTMRLFKTRSLAAEACEKGWIMRDGKTLKPAHTVDVGQIITVKRNPVLYSFRITRLAHTRLGAKLVPEYMDNVTTPEQLEILRLQQISNALGRARGTGRPTKKERRDLEQFIESDYGLEGGWDWLDDDGQDEIDPNPEHDFDWLHEDDEIDEIDEIDEDLE